MKYRYREENEMKDSGVEWVGMIPKEWEITKLKYLGTAITGLTYSPKDIVDKENGLLVLRSSNIQQGNFSYKNGVILF